MADEAARHTEHAGAGDASSCAAVGCDGFADTASTPGAAAPGAARLRFWQLPPGAVPKPRRRPATLVHGSDDAVPAPTLIALSLQHAMLALTYLIYPLVAASVAGFSDVETEGLLSVSALCMGLATIVQCARSRFGSGLLIVHIPSPGAIPLAQQAFLMGGPGMVAMSTLILGVSQMFAARLIRPLQILLPPEVCGVAVTMLGVSLADAGLRRAFGTPDASFVVHHGSLATALLTLGTAVAITVFAPRAAKIFALLAGAALGWIFAALVGVIHVDMAAELAKVSLVALPNLALPEWRFDPALLPLVALVLAMGLLDVFSTTVTLERMDDADWRRPNMGATQRAVTASGIGNVLAGLVTGFPIATSSSAVGLAFATGATSRIIGVVAGAMVCAAAFFPKVIMALSLIPSPVIGGIILFTAAFMIATGMNLILTHRLNDRRIFMVGLSIILGLATCIFPLVSHVPVWVHPIFSTPLTVSATAAILLNLAFRIGVTQEGTLAVAPQDDAFLTVRAFLEKMGDQWGARRDIIGCTIPVVAQAIEMLRNGEVATGPLDLHARFDETSIDVHILYDGEVISLPSARPMPDALLGTRTDVLAFSAFLLTQLADKARFSHRQNRACVSLHFHH